MSAGNNIFDSITASSKTAIDKIETELKKNADGNELTVDNLMKFQVSVNKWNIISQMGSAIVKAAGDAMKSIIQRVN